MERLEFAKHLREYLKKERADRMEMYNNALEQRTYDKNRGFIAALDELDQKIVEILKSHEE